MGVKIFFPLFSLNRYNSAPVGQISIKKYGSVVREDPFPMTPVRYNSAAIGQILIYKMWACWQRRSHCNDPGLVFLGAIVSEKKIVKKNFFPLFPLNHYNSAPICQILIKKIWACRARRALSNGSGPAFQGAILSENKIVQEKFFFPLFHLNRYYSAPIGQILI
ncbi:hypothetical protein V1477_017796 [Vespula maculifrons]|uniref:Uncharacterized protein n=1 Tax=Vespula maculifrons TaxID=7453 RepID=A0ABD2B0I5_VESMC